MSGEWETIRFGDCARRVSDVVQPRQMIAGTAYIGLEHIVEGALHLSGHSDTSDVASAKSRFGNGDILFGKLRPYFRKVVRPKFAGVCSTDIWVVRANEGVDQGFLFYRMASEDFIDMSMGSSTGTRMPRADWRFLSQWVISLPPLPEQRRIAKILGDLDDKIELNRKMNETLEQMARALFKSWFVDFDPVRAKMEGRTPTGMDAATAALFPDRLVDSELGPIPEGWEVKALDSIATFLNGLALQKYPASGGQTLRVIKIAQLRSGNTVGADECSSEIPGDYIIEDGDVLFSWSGSLEVELWCGGSGALNQHLFKVTSNETPKWFYYQWLRHHLPEFREIAADKATTMGHIQRRHLTEALVLVPGAELITAMTNAMQPIHSQLINNNIQSRTLSTLRDTLLPKLVSGDVRV